MTRYFDDEGVGPSSFRVIDSFPYLADAQHAARTAHWDLGPTNLSSNSGFDTCMQQPPSVSNGFPLFDIVHDNRTAGLIGDNVSLSRATNPMNHAWDGIERPPPNGYDQCATSLLMGRSPANAIYRDTPTEDLMSPGSSAKADTE